MPPASAQPPEPGWVVEEGGELQWWPSRALAWAEQPILLLMQATIPMAEPGAYQRPRLVLAMGLSPCFVVWYLNLLTWRALLVAAGMGGALAALVAAGTRGDPCAAPHWGCGSGYPIGAALVALYGFAMAAMWIDRLATEVVGLLRLLGVMGNVNPAVMGVTVLAWGNSLMDLINNTSMASCGGGGNSMAMTACYAGPLFNLLVGLGLGTAALLRDNHAARAAVGADPVVLVGCGFMLAACAAIVVCALRCGRRLPGSFGWVMVAWYCAYLVAVLVALAAERGTA